MRKTLSVIMSVLMILSVACMGVYAAEATAITTAEQFAQMDPYGNYYLDADITISASYDAEPVADGKTDLDAARGFKGTLDGKGHTITVEGCAVFANLNGKVLNLTIAGNDITVDGDFGVLAIMSQIGMYAENVTNNVNVSATGEGIAVAGLVARSGEGYKKCNFVNCTNNGNITANSSVAPVITAEDPEGKATKDKDFFVGGIAGRCDVIIAQNCVNNGKIQALSLVTRSPKGFAGGLAACAAFTAGSNYVIFEHCVNNGEVYSSLRAAGILATVGCKDNYADSQRYGGSLPFIVRGNVNNGEITGHSHTAGIVGYVYSTATKTDEVIELTFNVNSGKLNGGGALNANDEPTDSWISNIMAYANGQYNEIAYNIGVGEMTFHGEANCTEPHWTFVGCSTANYEQSELFHDNYIVDVAGVTQYTTYASAEKNAANIKDIAWGETNNFVKRVSADELKDGSIAYAINSVAKVNGFNQTIGVDMIPSPLPTSKYVVSNGAGGYENSDSKADFELITLYSVDTADLANGDAGSTDDTTVAGGDATDTTAAPSDDTTTAPAESSSNAPAESSTPASDTASDTGSDTGADTGADTTAAAGDKGCGSVIGCGVAVVALLGVAYVAKKKVND